MKKAKGAMPPKRKPSKNSLGGSKGFDNEPFRSERYAFKTGQMFKKGKK